jgi:hypothetical protein
MKLTKTDEQRIDKLTSDDVWKITVKASEYAQFYKLRYLEVLKEKLDYRIKAEQGIYDAQLKIGTNE